jgi:hypothetical protein
MSRINKQDQYGERSPKLANIELFLIFPLIILGVFINQHFPKKILAPKKNKLYTCKIKVGYKLVMNNTCKYIWLIFICC